MSAKPEVPRELAKRFDVRAVGRQAAQMVTRLERRRPGFVAALRTDPIGALSGLDEVTFDLRDAPVWGGCSVLGSYNPAVMPPAIEVTRTPSLPQTWYSALHELGHHEQQGDLAWGQAALVAADRDRARRLEEQVSEAFAAEILLGADTVEEVIGDVVPTAKSIADLHEATGASRSACAVRVVQLLRAPGIAMVATADGKVFFSAVAGDLFLPKRGTVQPPDSVVVRAVGAGSAQSRDASIMYGSGSTLEGFAADAVRDGDYVYAVFVEGTPGWARAAYAPKRVYWGSKDRHCRCGTSYEGGSGGPCRACGRRDRCPDCGRCACEPEQEIDKQCDKCFLVYPPAMFPDGGTVCSECS